MRKGVAPLEWWAAESEVRLQDGPYLEGRASPQARRRGLERYACEDVGHSIRALFGKRQGATEESDLFVLSRGSRKVGF